MRRGKLGLKCNCKAFSLPKDRLSFTLWIAWDLQEDHQHPVSAHIFSGTNSVLSLRILRRYPGVCL